MFAHGVLHVDPFGVPIPEQRFLITRVMGCDPSYVDGLPRRDRIALYIRCLMEDTMHANPFGFSNDEDKERLKNEIRGLADGYLDLRLYGYFYD